MMLYFTFDRWVVTIAADDDRLSVATALHAATASMHVGSFLIHVLGTNSIQEQGRNHQCASHLCSFFIFFAMATHPKYMLYVFDQQKKMLIMIDSTRVEK
jgi:hypothetical protein